ncbi:MAG: sugar phosphate isomerase/epimerase family protein [Planctomycetota bacterium]
MRYAICNETFGDWDLDRALQLAASAGYTGWEVAPFMLAEHVDDFSSSLRESYRQKVESAGLQVVGLHWLLAKTQGFHLTTRDGSTRERTAEHIRKLICLCRDLGGDVMVLGSPQQRNRTEGQSMEEAMQNAALVLGSVVDALHEHEVKIALEPLGPEEGDFLNTAESARELQSRIGDDHIGLHLDVKAMSTEAESIEKIIVDNADVMMHFHANDPNRKGPGMGDVAFAPILATLQRVGYDGWISVEVFDYSPGVECLVEESIGNLKRALAEATT